MKRWLVAAVAVFALAAVIPGQSDKDLVGTWKMDASRSKFAGSGDAPALVVIKYERSGEVLRETLTVTNARGVTTRSIDYALDGHELVNGAGDDRVVSQIISKDGATRLQWTDDGGVFTRTIMLSADRRTMTISAHDSNPDVKSDDLIVLQRQ